MILRTSRVLAEDDEYRLVVRHEGTNSREFILEYKADEDAMGKPVWSRVDLGSSSEHWLVKQVKELRDKCDSLSSWSHTCPTCNTPFSGGLA